MANEKTIRMSDGTMVSEAELRAKNEAVDASSKANKATSQDYWQSSNPITIGVFHPDLQDKFSDVFDNTPVDLNNESVKAALDGLSLTEQKNILESSYNNQLVINQANRAKKQLESASKVEKDDGFEQFVKSFIPSMLTPTSIATLPIGGAGLAKGVFTAGSKVVATGAALGATTLAGDALTSSIYGAKQDIGEAALTGALFGGAIALPFAGIAMRNARKAKIAEEFIAHESKVSQMYTHKLNEDGTIATNEDGSPQYIFKKETETVTSEEKYKPDSPEYQEAKSSFDKEYNDAIVEHSRLADEIKAEGYAKSTAIQSQIDEIDALIEKAKKDIELPENAPKVDLQEPSKEKIKVVEDVKKTLTDDDILKQAKKETADVVSKAKQDSSVEILKATQKVNQFTEAMKALGKAHPDTVKALENVNNAKQELVSAKSKQNDIINKIISEHSAKLPREITTQRIISKPAGTLIDKSPEKIAKEIKKAKDVKLNEFTAPLKAQKNALNASLKELKAVEKANTDAKLKAHKANKLTKPKFEAPSYQKIEQKETGRLMSNEVIEYPKRSKLLNDPDTESIFYSITSKITNTVNAIDDFLGSKVDVLAQSENPLIRAVGAKLALPTYAERLADGRVNFVYGESAVEYKGRLKGFHSVNIRDSLINFNEAKKAGFVTDYNDYNIKVNQHYNRYVKKNDEEAHAIARKRTAKDTSKKYDEHLKDAYNELDTKLDGPKWLEDGVRTYRDYFLKMGEEGKLLDMKGMRTISINKWYKSFVYDRKAINEMSFNELKETVYQGLYNHPGNYDKTFDELQASADEIAKSFKNQSFKEGMDITSFVTSDSFGANIKAKTLYLDAETIDKIINNDIEKITSAYHYKLSGRFALQNAFGDVRVENIIEAINRDAYEKGLTVTNKEKLALQEILEDTLGTFRLASIASGDALWQFSRSMQAFNVSRLLGLSGIVQVTELAGNASGLAIQGLLTKGQLGTHLNAFKKGLYNSNGKLDNEFAEFMFSCGFHDSAMMIHRSNRYGDMENGIALGTFERTTNYAASAISRISGMMGVLNFQESFMGASTIELIKRFGTPKMREQDKALLARWGLSEKDTISIKEDLLKHTDKTLKRFNYGDMNPINVRKLQIAVQRNTSENVIQGDSIHNPSFIKKASPIGKLVFQFMRFPLTAQTVLLRKGWNTDKASLIGSIIGSTLSYMVLQWMLEETKIASGLVKEEDRKYDIFNNVDHARNLGFKAFGYAAALGMFTTGYNELAIMTPLPALGSTFEKQEGISGLLGPSASLFDSLAKISYKKLNGEELTASDQRQLNMLMIGATLPLVKEGMFELEEHYSNN